MVVFHSYVSLPHGNWIRVQIRGRSCADGFGRYKAECIGCTTTKCSACYFFSNYKMKNITLSGSENNSKPVLPNPMHPKLKNSQLNVGIATMIFPNDIL